jgi:hypothetical protein
MIRGRGRFGIGIDIALLRDGAQPLDEDFHVLRIALVGSQPALPA